MSPLSKTVVILKLGPNVAGAACRMHAGRHSAGCRIACETLRSDGTSFRITGLAYRESCRNLTVATYIIEIFLQ
ncbi:hypothetical protein JT739_01605 [Tepidanaerobacter sp. GT38]|uniref:hypothetical protein n=1 Tax=Tepidanaerobacter sp. GT38 TaxID=2722793 RepID=UPI001F3CC71F|nr:hypothetical protein [Tepidanaerobacter sp. GT38]MCG1011283.1 hypothetical protein [Tepidanaerobacter sp. GT38]